jgi:hypothetical protein
VAVATTRFAAVAAKSDALEDIDVTASAKRAREATKDEDARLQAAYVRLYKARETLTIYGASSIAWPIASSSMAAPLDAGDEADLKEKASLRTVKRKLVTLKHGWLDIQGKVHQRSFDMHALYQIQMDILWKLRKALREQSEAALDEHNKAERAA